MTTPESRTILLGVTVDASLILVRGFPEYLRDHGWSVHVVSASGPNLDRLRSIPGITTHAIEMTRNPSPVADFKALISWVRILKRVRPSVTSVGTPKAGLLGGIAALITRVPHRVYILRGLRMETAKGLQHRILSFLECVSMFTAQTVVAVSPSLRSRTLESGLVAPEKLTVIGSGSSNGVDLLHFDRRSIPVTQLSELQQSLNITPGVPIIGFVGRLAPDKGLAVLSEARALLIEKGYDHHLLVVGGIDDQAAPELLSGLRTLGRPIIETGHVSDTRAYYALMDILCLPTRREGFPNVVLEASAMMVPTVTTKATGAIDSVVDTTTGLLVDVDNPKQLARALMSLLSSPDSRTTLGRAARERVERHFSRPIVWSNMDLFYRGLVDD